MKDFAHNFGRDLRLGLRMLLRRGLLWMAIPIVAIGIGASVMMFSVINNVLLRPLPYQDADRLVKIWGKSGF